ncbi:hypothetical protein AAFF_G00223760 [Aldrovandia affinis]|uniref:Type II GnRH receptor n=1 Tax=Aldrovandia affinis TaxID=143900 RepID=A0AAD7TB63_9TELE|nr:hypothetical protein AAFF_G00223760 [Aldrovandia affinis]
MVLPVRSPAMNDTFHRPESSMFDQMSMSQQNGSCGMSDTPCEQGGAADGAVDGAWEDALQLPTFSTAAKVRVIITFVLCAVSAVCNLAVLWAASTNHKRKSHVRILIINLTAADLLVTFVVMPLDAVWNITVQWLAGDAACRLLMFLKLLAMYSGAFVTVVISLDRQSAILNPLAINEAKKKNKVMLSVAWLMSAVLSLPQVFIFHNVTIAVPPQNFTQCTTQGSFARHWQETIYNMFTFICLFLLPLAIMIFCYSRILVEISKRMTKGNISSKEVHLRRSKNNIPKARMRALKMTIVIVVSFIETVSHSLTHMLFIFGLFNACLDPITYGLFTVRFRKGLKRYCHGATVLVESDNHSTASFIRSASTFRMKRVGSQRPAGGAGLGAEEGGPRRSLAAETAT